MILFVCLLLVPLVTAGNRSSCFRYLDCQERAESVLKECSGGTGVGLTLSSKDNLVSEMIKGRGRVVNSCQDHLTAEIIDFDSLQVLVFEDARECFEKLPGSGRKIEFNPETCVYEPTLDRDHYGKDTYQCAVEYFSDRQQCEQLLECCPDHVRCGERMNAVSVAYQHARSKSLQIVSNILRCVVSNDPTAVEIVGELQKQRSSLRNAGLPFFRPDMATEERISRRLSLTSETALDQRRQRFNRRYHQVRALLSQRVRNHGVGKGAESVTATEKAQPIPSHRRVAIVKNLLRNANDDELAKYVSLIADGNFDKLSQLERQKVIRLQNEDQVNVAMEKMKKIKDAIKAALSTKQMKTLDFLETSSGTEEKAARVEELNEWKDVDLDRAMASIDSSTLVRAKKFATDAEDALRAQKELMLSNKDTFTGNGLPSARTSSKSPHRDDRMVHDFNTLTHKLRDEEKVGVANKELAEPKETTPLATPIDIMRETMEPTLLPLAESRMVSIIQPGDEQLMAEEGSGSTLTTEEQDEVVEKDQTTAEGVQTTKKTVKKAEETTTAANEEKTTVTQETPVDETTIKSEEKVTVTAQETTTVSEEKTTVVEEKAEATTETALLEALEGVERRERQKEEKKTMKVEKEKKKEEEKREIEAEAVVIKESKKVIGDVKMSKDPVADVIALAVAQENKKKEKKDKKKPKEQKKENVEEKHGEKKEEVTVATPAEVTPINITNEAKKMMKKMIKQMKKAMESIKAKMSGSTSTSTESPSTTTITTTTSTTTTTEAPAVVEVTEEVPIEKKEKETETAVEEPEGSGVEQTADPIPVVEEAITLTPSIQRDEQVKHCVVYAGCDELVRDYRNQCDARYSKDIISHGIEDSEILSILSNSSISSNEIVTRACLRPLDKNAHSTLRQLLVIERGVKRACLELGHNKLGLDDEQTAVCHSELPTTEPLDDFLSSHHVRSEENHLGCLGRLAPFQDQCSMKRSCCGSANACDNYLSSSPVSKMKQQSIDLLVERQTTCEKRMLDTLSYIQKQLSTRRRRVV